MSNSAIVMSLLNVSWGQMDAEPTQQAQLRRLQDTLAVVGGGVIAFGTWSVVKIALLFALFSEEAVHQIFRVDNNIPTLVVFAVTIFIACLDLLIRLFVGLSARAEGRGEKKGSFYLVVAGLIAVANAFSVASLAFGSTTSSSLLDAAVTVAIDVTSLVTLILMIRCAVQLRQLSRQAE